MPDHCACIEATLVTGARSSIAHLGALEGSISEPVEKELSLSVQYAKPERRRSIM